MPFSIFVHNSNSEKESFVPVEAFREEFVGKVAFNLRLEGCKLFGHELGVVKVVREKY